MCLSIRKVREQDREGPFWVDAERGSRRRSRPAPPPPPWTHLPALAPSGRRRTGRGEPPKQLGQPRRVGTPHSSSRPRGVMAEVLWWGALPAARPPWMWCPP